VYNFTGKIFDAEQVAYLLSRLSVFDLSAPGGSFMPESDRVKARFYPFLKDSFKGVWAYATLVVLEPSAQIVAHKDEWTGALTRYHIPLQLNEWCWVYTEADWRRDVGFNGWQQLELGYVYKMNPGLPHGAVNWGTTRRIHLLIDTPNVTEA
jgi:hypothetical protein